MQAGRTPSPNFTSPSSSRGAKLAPAERSARPSWLSPQLNFSTTDPVTGSNGEASTTATPAAAGSLTATAADGSLKVTFALTGTNGVVAEPASTQTVTIADATSGATVYYTTDGSTPTASSTKYTGPITITAATTLKFIAIKSGDSSSALRTITITVQ